MPTAGEEHHNDDSHPQATEVVGAKNVLKKRAYGVIHKLFIHMKVGIVIMYVLYLKRIYRVHDDRIYDYNTATNSLCLP